MQGDGWNNFFVQLDATLTSYDSLESMGSSILCFEGGTFCF
jgi:hypothetical protein